MFTFDCTLRVRYAETDQMGYVYYGNYAQYYEVARVEMLRSLGTSYRQMEENGVMMPVLELQTKFIKPGKYDEQLRIHVEIRDKPSIRIRFHYAIYNSDEELINTGETTLVFVDIRRNKPCPPPDDFMERLAPYFSET